MGRFSESVVTIEAAMQRAERDGDLVGMPEMLRIKGETLASMPGADLCEAEAVLVQSLELAGSQSALSLELRTAMSLVSLWSRQGRKQEAKRMLASVYGRFTEGFGTADLQTAKRMLNAPARHGGRGVGRSVIASV
jgi:predicted ATPase